MKLRHGFAPLRHRARTLVCPCKANPGRRRLARGAAQERLALGESVCALGHVGAETLTCLYAQIYRGTQVAERKPLHHNEGGEAAPAEIALLGGEAAGSSYALASPPRRRNARE